MLYCKLCDYSHPTMISPSHIKKHGITSSEYKLRFPGTVLRIQTEESKAKMSASKKGKPSKLIGVKHSEEHIQNQRLSLKLSYSTGKIKHWNAGKKTPEEVKQKIAAGNRNIDNLGNLKQREQKHERIKNVALSKNCTVLEINDDNRRTTALCLTCKFTFSFTNQIFYENRLEKTQKLCPQCEPRTTYSSLGEQELCAFIKSVYSGSVISNDRQVLGGKELDIYLPELNLAFEYTGLFWHAEKQNSENRHLLWKKQFAHTLGVRVITVFEDEWKNKQEIVKSRVMSILGRTALKIFARKCIFVKPDSKTKNQFLVDNHLQGADTSSDWIGLEYAGELVALGTFKKTNMVKGGDGSQYELSRFVNKINTTVIGGASKIIKQFKSAIIEPLISYADSRWSDGELYRSIGFKFVGVTPPSYWYIDQKYEKRVHRSTFMKHRLIKKYGFTADQGSEWELAKLAGHDRIWDCGTTKWIFE